MQPLDRTSARESAEAYNDLGVLLAGRGMLDSALECFEMAVRRDPLHAAAHNNMGAALRQSGWLDEAIASIRRALRLSPEMAEAHGNLGNALRQQGRLDEALDSLRQATRLKPGHAEGFVNLGLALAERGEFDEAVDSFRHALGLDPRHELALLALGNALKDRGRLIEAADCCREALRLRPDCAEAHLNLGVVLGEQGRAVEAVACYREALRRKPSLAEAQVSLGNTLRDMGRTEEAAASYRKALAHRPSAALRILSATLLPPIYDSSEDLGRWRARLVDNLEGLRRTGVTLDLTDEPAHPLFYLAYQGRNDREIQQQAASLYQPPHEPGPEPAPPRGAGDGRIRVGFLSRHFRSHTIGELLRGTIAQLSRDSFHVTVFSIGCPRERIADEIRRHADRFIALPERLRVARQLVMREGVDVLVFTDIGMEELSYSLAFSRLAPVQAVFWGHPVTTGIPTMDYFLSSELLEPDDAELHYTENLVRLPALPVYYQLPRLPVSPKGRRDFGLPGDSHLYACPQSLFKLHPEFDAILAEILRQDPRGIVVLIRGKYPSWTDRLSRRLATTMGDVVDRVRFVDRLDREGFLALNAASDVLLDPIHFGGGNTSYEGLGLGVPIVTWPSPFLRGRITLALYRQMGMLDCVASDPEDYARIAVRLGVDPGYRAAIRSKILATHHVLFENPAGVRGLETFLKEAARARGVAPAGVER
jgi:predicted O-linked N-acetylglucosamine transferase (SPINDLY family)